MQKISDPHTFLKDLQLQAASLRKHREQYDQSGVTEETKPLIHDILLLNRLLRQAEPFRSAGGEVTPMDKYSGITKKLALFAGSTIVHLLRFITDKQIAFNSLIFSALKEISAHLYRVNRSITLRDQQYQREIAELKREIEGLKRSMQGLRDK